MAKTTNFKQLLLIFLQAAEVICATEDGYDTGCEDLNRALAGLRRIMNEPFAKPPVHGHQNLN